MKKGIQRMLALMLLLGIMYHSIGQVQQVKQSSGLKTMTWTTQSQAARQLAQQGSEFYMNIELPQAYGKFVDALKLDPDFTVALVFLSYLTTGETKKDFAEKAIKTAANKTEGEKLFASLADVNLTQDQRRDVWAKLHQMFPDGQMIGNYYVVTRATPEERFAAAQEYIQKYPNNAWMYNTIAYYYMLDKKDMESAKKNFEKYIQLYPKGYNPYDSMGEYYLNAGDMDNSKKFYTIALEKYPFNTSSLNALEKIAEAAKKKQEKQ